MTQSLDNIKLSDPEFEKLRDLIYEVSGIRYAQNKKYLLESRLLRRIRERSLTSFEDYYRFLKVSPLKQEEFTFLFNEITTNETSFFRNLPQLKALERNVLPEVIKNKGAIKRLKIWSAACSSGEEAYTLAMIAREVLGSEADRWTIEIEATDISTEMLNKGRGGVYSSYAMRGTPLIYRERYFEKTSDGSFQVSPALKRMVHFSFLNFSNDAGMKRMHHYDLIFCRNVLIYFDNDAKKRFVDHFYNALTPGGYYFIGHSETLHGLSESFEQVTLPGTMAYKKASARESIRQRMESKPRS